MSLVRWLGLRTPPALNVTGIVMAAITVVAWGRMVTRAAEPWPAATVFLLGHGVGLMVACLVGLLLSAKNGAPRHRPDPPRFMIILPLLQVPILIVLGLILRVSGHTAGAAWGLAALLPVVAQLIVLVALGLSLWLIVPLVRTLARLTPRARPSRREVDAAGIAWVLLIFTVLGGVIFVGGIMLAGMAPDGAGTRAGLLRSALRTLWSGPPDSSGWVWVGRIGLVLALLAGSPLVLARRG